MLPNVQQATIKPVITQAVAPGTLINTDEYDIYARLPAWGYGLIDPLILYSSRLDDHLL
jgi:transposase